AFGAPGRRISAVVAVVIVVIVIAAEGAAAALGSEAAAPTAAAAALFLAVLLGGLEEPEGLSAHRLVVVGGGVDLLFRRGVDSVLGELVVAAALRLLLEQEPEVFSLGLGLILLGDDPEVELLCIPMQRSQSFVRCRWVPFGGRLSALWDRVDGGDGEG